MKKFLIFFIVLCFMFLITAEVYFPIKHVHYLNQISEEYNVELATIMALIKVESNFREQVVSRKGAIGMMQVMPTTAEWIVKKEKIDIENYNLYNYKDNIIIGITYYNYLEKRFDGDLEKILAAYNAGASRVANDKWKDIKETREYVFKIKIYRIVYKLLLIFNGENKNYKKINV